MDDETAPGSAKKWSHIEVQSHRHECTPGVVCLFCERLRADLGKIREWALEANDQRLIGMCDQETSRLPRPKIPS